MTGEGLRAGALRGALVVVAVLLLFGAGLWTVSRMGPAPAGPRAGSGSEADVEYEEDPLSLTVVPPRVPPGTASVRVAAACAAPPEKTTAQSAAFMDSVAFARAPSGTAMYADAELDPELPPGRYQIFALCGTRFGSAELEIEGRKGPEPKRTATTTITLTPARPGDWRDHPDGERTSAELGSGWIFFRVRITHEVRVPADDPDVAALRAGAAGGDPSTFVSERLGSFSVRAPRSLFGLGYAAPVVRTDSGAREAVITYTALDYGAVDPSEPSTVGVAYDPPAAEGVPRLDAHEIVVLATGWTVAGVSGPPPLAQDAHLLRLNGGDRPARVAFARDGTTGPMAYFLGENRDMAAFLEGTDPSDQGPEEEQVSTGPLGMDADGFVGRAWVAALVAGLVAAVLLLLSTLARALGRPWWRRRRNWVLVAMAGGGYGWYLLVGEADLPALLLVAGLPALALLSTFRAANGRGDLPRAEAAVAAAVAAALAGLVLAAWPLAASFGGGPAAGVLAVAAGAAGVTAAVPRLRRLFPPAGLVLLGAGAMLAGMAAVAGHAPPSLMWLALVVVGWGALVFGWVTEAGHRWSAVSAARWVAAATVACGAQVYAVTDLDPRSTWTSLLPEDLLEVAGTVAFMSVPLLALTMLVVRVRRFGGSAEGLTEPAAFHTAVLLLLLTRAQTVDPVAGIMILLVWAGVFVLLPAPRAELLRAVPPEEHRRLVRDLIRRRSARAALTALLRQAGEGDDFEQRRQALERAGDEHEGPLDSDLALTTLAGRTPWQNALASLGVGAALSLPFSVVRISESLQGLQAGGQELAAAALALLSLPALSMVFGYFYPRVRGTNPVAKCLAFFLAALLVELPTYVYTLARASIAQDDWVVPPTADGAFVGVLVAVGNIAVVSIGLGLWWEWRLMWLAGEPWGRVRDVRTLRALAAPLAAVAIAAATTAATAMVNNVIAPLPSGPPAAEATPTPTRTP
ncbi:hypothetical protein [[Actinomadura] parvosata]|uniref:hypothetical protein n=1 Tax=[Actinomadura] parvosata TaxID=1955412 RepID=UPI0012BC8338|nr:hypothetical protein [Nonomuraea sp. ATCC 55076]